MSPKLSFYKFHQHATIPSSAYFGDAGYDLAAVKNTIVPAHGKAIVSTGLGVVFPIDYVQDKFGPEFTMYGRIAPRSGFSWKYHTDIGAGVIDAGYKGEIGVVVFNHSSQDIEINVGDRIAQLIVCVVASLDTEEVSLNDFEKPLSKTFSNASIGVLIIAD